MVKQISVFLEKKRGRIYRASQVLAAAEINIRALSIADTSSFGILRLIVDKPEAALAALKAANYTAKISQVIAVEVEDRPGGMEHILATIEEANIDMEYLYALLGKKNDNAILIFQVEDTDSAAELLTKAGIALVKANDLYEL